MVVRPAKIHAPIRAGVDVAIDPGQSTDLRVFLRAGPKALTEAWTFPWRA